MSDCRFGVSPVNYPDPDPAYSLSHFIEIKYSLEETEVLHVF